MVLCHSRMAYVEFTCGEAMEHFLACHQNALEFFGGTPGVILIDNLKTGVLKHPFGERAVFNPRYLDFAAHYGFEARACNVRKANEKGRVENGVGYVKKNFLAGRDGAVIVVDEEIRAVIDERMRLAEQRGHRAGVLDPEFQDFRGAFDARRRGLNRERRAPDGTPAVVAIPAVVDPRRLMGGCRVRGECGGRFRPVADEGEVGWLVRRINRLDGGRLGLLVVAVNHRREWR